MEKEVLAIAKPQVLGSYAVSDAYITKAYDRYC